MSNVKTIVLKPMTAKEFGEKYGSHSPLKNSQNAELQCPRKSSTQTPKLPTAVVMKQSAESKLWSRPPVERSTQMEQSETASNLWSIPQVEVKDDLMPASLKECSLKSSSFILGEVNADVLKLRKENQELKQSFEAQVEHIKALDVARQKDRKEISEKNAVIENMRAQIVKLEKEQLATFEFIPKQSAEKPKENVDLYATRGAHELKFKDLERECSQLKALNLDLKDVEKQYVEELNCLKVNLTSAEEIIKQNRAEIAELRALDVDKQKKI